MAFRLVPHNPPARFPGTIDPWCLHLSCVLATTAIDAHLLYPTIPRSIIITLNLCNLCLPDYGSMSASPPVSSRHISPLALPVPEHTSLDPVSGKPGRGQALKLTCPETPRRKRAQGHSARWTHAGIRRGTAQTQTPLSTAYHAALIPTTQGEGSAPVRAGRTGPGPPAISQEHTTERARRRMRRGM